MNILPLFLAIALAALNRSAAYYINVPTPASGILGQSATFSCEVEPASSYVEWYFGTLKIYYNDDGDEEYVGGRGDYLAEREGQVYKMTIRNMELSDAGRYGCRVIGMSVAFAELIVLEEPRVIELTSNKIEGSTATFACDANFGGPDMNLIGEDHYPELAMYLGGTRLDGTVNEKLPEGPITHYTLSMEYDLTLEASLNEQLITCEITTRSPAERAAANTQVEVLYSVRNQSYTPNQARYEIGEIMTCTADGNPEPTYNWRNTETGDSTGNSLLHITEEMVGPNAWVCEARNNINGQDYEVTTQAQFRVAFPWGKEFEIYYQNAVASDVLIMGQDETLTDIPILPSGLKSALVNARIGAIYEEDCQVIEVVSVMRNFFKLRLRFICSQPDFDLLRLEHASLLQGDGWVPDADSGNLPNVYMKWSRA